MTRAYHVRGVYQVRTVHIFKYSQHLNRIKKDENREITANKQNVHVHQPKKPPFIPFTSWECNIDTPNAKIHSSLLSELGTSRT
jgi:hypothetical protein